MSQSDGASRALRVLFVEDDPNVAERLLLELRRCGYTVVHERVETATTMMAALERTTWDLILSDDSMPSFPAPAALSVLSATGMDLPFLVLSRANDCRDSLLPAIERALRNRVGLRSDAAEVPAKAVASAQARRGRILVVDDESMITDALRRTLRDHDVTAVNAANEALALIAHGTRFDLILSDLMMPQMTGIDLHRELSRIAPDQAERMVFLTGGAFSPQAREYLDRVSTPCIEKPFEPRQVRAVVSERVR
jgi:CheY-like chemotaxis protein